MLNKTKIIGRFSSYSVYKKGTKTMSFGCGAVEASTDTIEAYLELIKTAKGRKVVDLINQIRDYRHSSGIVSTEDVKTIKLLLKNMK